MPYKQLKNLVKLSHKVTFYVPSQSENFEAVENVTDEVARTFTDLFGGSTSTSAIGYWTHVDGRLAKESVTLVFSYAEKLTDASIDAVYNLALSIKARLGQESIAIEINGELYFI